MNDDLANLTDDELEVIVRRAENTNIPGSLFQRAKIELELRDRKRQSSHDLVESLKIRDTVEKKVKRGKESWNFFWLVFGISLTAFGSFISILPFGWLSKVLFFILTCGILAWACLISAKWQNKLIGLKSFLENSWKKL